VRRVGIISNPLSRANRAGLEGLAARAAPRHLHAAPRSHEELEETLGAFAREGVELLVVNGGDGTLREVLTALPRAFGATPPEIALLAAGKINLAARDVGSAGRGPDALDRLLRAAEDGTLRRAERPVIEIGWPGEPERRVRGFLFGAGAFAEGNRIAEAHVHRRGIHDAAAVAVTTALMLARSCFSGFGREVMADAPMRVAPDGQALAGERQFLMLATTLNRLVLGLWPFWGEGMGAIRWLTAAAPPKRLGAALWAVARRRPGGWMEQAGYSSGRAAQIHVELDRPFVLDGESFAPGKEGILLSAPDRIAFVAP
jgi:hypothetical protein